MPLITSCATLGYAGFGFDFAVKSIAALGFRHVEITELGSYCRHFPFQEASVESVRHLLDSHGLRPIAMNVSASRMMDGKIHRPRIADPEEAPGVVAYAEWFLDQAAALEIPTVSFPIGPRVAGVDWERDAHASVIQYRRIADHALARGLTLNLEVPHLYQLTDSVPHAKAIFELLDHPAVGATVDSSHWGILGYDLSDFFAFLGSRLKHVHLRDSSGTDTGGFNQDLELTPGRGSVDFLAFGLALDKAGYKGEVSLELEHRHTDAGLIEQEYEFGIAHLKGCGWSVCNTGNCFGTFRTSPV